MVFIHHYVAEYQAKIPTTLYSMLSELHIGVTVFFVLSGFLIAYRYMNKVEVSKAWVYQYFKNRVARIYPMYFLLSTCAFVYYYYHHDTQATIPVYLSNITFLRGFSSSYKFTGIGQGWSLTVEECFYALAPVMLLLRKRINIWLMAAITLAFAFVMADIFKNTDFYGFFGTPQFVFSYTYFGRCLEFIIGIQLALMIKNKVITDRTGFAYTFIGIMGIVTCLYTYTFFPAAGEMDMSTNTVARIFINNVLCATFISILFYGLITEQNMFRRFLSTPLMKLLGESSYIFYLIHFGFVFSIVAGVVPMFGGARFFVLFLILNVISVILYKFVEHPVNKFIRSHFN
jgi:peptidoglycan/LPS O-acetylase OafA/YrhL